MELRTLIITALVFVAAQTASSIVFPSDKAKCVAAHEKAYILTFPERILGETAVRKANRELEAHLKCAG
jgi:hypothetical protein